MHKEQCPRCAKEGRDRSKDNLAVYDDGHKYCFGCSLYIPPKLSERLNNHYGHNITINKVSTPKKLVTDLPSAALQWLLQYGIRQEEIKKFGLVWNPNNDSLVFPIYDGDILKATNERSFGTKLRTKYYISGSKDYLPILQQGQPTSVYILCEDFVSAIKISRHFNAIPLLGAIVPTKLLLSMLRLLPVVRIWLDFNKAQEAMKFAAQARQYIPNCGTIVTLKDPKEYNDTEIKEIVSRTLSSNQSIS